MRRHFAAMMVASAMAACGGDGNQTATRPPEPVGNEAMRGVNAELANDAAEAEARDAAIGGSVSDAEVAAAEKPSAASAQ